MRKSDPLPEQHQALMRKYPLAISRNAYIKLYNKVMFVYGSLQGRNLRGLGSVNLLFRMISSYAGSAQCQQDFDDDYLQKFPLMYHIFCSVLEDVDEARERSRKARQRAKARAERLRAEKAETEKAAQAARTAVTAAMSSPSAAPAPAAIHPVPRDCVTGDDEKTCADFDHSQC